MSSLEVLQPLCSAESEAPKLTVVDGDSTDELPFYQPQAGELRAQETRKTRNGLGTLHIGTYATKLATHRVGIYTPEGYTPDAETPVVAMTTALFTSAAGHNQKVAEEIMAMDNVVVVKGPPRYYGPTLRSLTLAQDANEMHGLLNKVERSGLVKSAEEAEVYGESQAAMKLLAFLAIASSYGRQSPGGLAVAPAYVVSRLDLTKPWQSVGHGIHVVGGMIVAAASSLIEGEFGDLAHTLNPKDAHHHVIVIPVLTSGEAGVFLDHIDPLQNLDVELFGKDGPSNPYKTKTTLNGRFPKMVVNVTKKYGHVGGIRSQETRDRRREVFGRQAAA